MLLCNVLHRFKESLEQLTNIKCRCDKLPDHLDRLPGVLDNILNNVLIFGDHLSVIVRSSAAETYLQTIVNFLFVDARKVWMPEIKNDADFAHAKANRYYLGSHIGTGWC